MVMYMKKNGYTIIEMLIVIIVLGIFTVGILTTTSYAYKDKTPEFYRELVDSIERQATLYGKTLNNLKEEKNLVVTLNDLVEAGYYIGDDNGNVTDPRNSKATLNGLKIKITYNEDESITAEVIEE